jgi:NAD(P)-dependent dehydrogenase (short-subunit alcohol dehydrogenase family)
MTPVVLVTGATGPLGRAASARFARDGARLALVSRDLDRLNELGRGLGIAEDQWLAVAADVATADGARTAADAATARWGRIDVLLHLVGGWVGGTSVVDLDDDELRGMLDQHLWTTLYAVRAVVPGMLDRGYGRVIGVSSPFATDVRAKGASYAIGKAAEEVLVGTLAREVANSGVTANVVLARTIDANHERESSPSSKNASWTTPEEMADVLAFLASPAAAAINGARIPLDGRG